MYSAIIIEDEYHNRELLRNLLQQYAPDVNILAEADSIQTARQLLQENQPDLIFLDIELPDGKGFDLLKATPNLDFEVIFTTAYDHYALHAIRFCALDYLLKPLKINELQEALQKARRMLEQKNENLRLKELIQNLNKPQQPKRLALATGEKLEFVSSDQIIRCQGENNYTRFFLLDGRQILVCQTLREYEDLLKPQGFVRVHQSNLVNINQVKSFVRSDGGYLELVDGSKVQVARTRKEELLRALMRN